MRLTLILLITLLVQPLTAQEIGPETGLSMPRFVSLKAASANVRRGPNLTHRIDWRYLHRGTPLMVIAEFDNWRNVRDVDGQGGWVHFSLLSGNRTLLVRSQDLTIHAQPSVDARIIARAQAGAILRLVECPDDWCLVTADGHEGYAPADGLWGSDRDLPQ